MSTAHSAYLRSGFDDFVIEIGHNPWATPYAAYNSFVDRVEVSYQNSTMSDVLATIDIVAHEFTHRFIHQESGLDGFNEYGALDESLSDIYGTLTEFNSRGSTGNWIIGDDAVTYGIRDLSNPNSPLVAGGRQPDTYRGIYWTNSSSDHGGVHINAGVVNYWFYLLSDGGSGTNDFGTTYSVSGIGKSDGAKIIQYVIENSLTTYTDFEEFRLQTRAAASTLFGTISAQRQAVDAAWTAVGLPYTPLDYFDNVYFESPGTSSCLSNSSALANYLSGNGHVNSVLLDYLNAEVRVIANDGVLNFSETTFNLGAVPSGLGAGNWKPYTLALGDIDNDGDQDMLIGSAFGTSSYKLFLMQNDGSDNFTDITADYALPDFPNTSGFGPIQGVSFLDYDLDGLLDIFILGGDDLFLLRYDIDIDDYVDETANFTTNTTRSWETMSVADINGDLYPDVFVGGTADCFLFINNGNGSFIETAPSQIPSDLRASSLSWADLDNDGDLDMLIGPKLTKEHQLLYFKNPLNGTNTNWDLATVVNDIDEHSTTSVGDYDNDGDLDIYTAPYLVVGNSRFFENNGNGAFNERFDLDIFADNKYHVQGAVWEDMDHDGKLDLTLSNTANAAWGISGVRCPGDIIYKNKVPNSNNWIQFTPVTTISNKSAFGTNIELDNSIQIQAKQVLCKSGLWSQPSKRLHFGMGSASTATNVEVTWPSGIVQRATSLAANQEIVITEGYPLVFDKTICSGTSTTLDPQMLTTSTGAHFNFYDDNLGFLSSGTNFTTPTLTSETTYYVSIFDPSFPAPLSHESPKIAIKIKIGSQADLSINGGNPTQTVGQTLSIDAAAVSHYTNFQWYLNGNAISGATSASITTNSLGVYYVVADPIFCVSSQSRISNEVVAADDCVMNPAYSNYDKSFANGGVHHFTSSQVLQNPAGYIFDGEFVIDEGVTIEFRNTDVLMTNCSGITVMPGPMTHGGELILNNTSIEGCGIWGGITVMGDPANSNRGTLTSHGRIETMNNSSISGAQVGIYSVDGGIVEIDAADFNFNRCHLAIMNYVHAHNAIIENSSFGYLLSGSIDYSLLCSGAPGMPSFNNPSFNKMVYIENVDDVKFDYCTFNGNHRIDIDDPLRFGVEVKDASRITVIDTDFSGHFSHALHLETCNECEHTDSQVSGDMGYGVYGTDLDNYYSHSAEFYSPATGGGMDNGVLVESSHLCVFSACVFYDLNDKSGDMWEPLGIGLQFYDADDNALPSKITGCVFDNLKVAIAVAPEVYPVYPSSGSPTTNASTQKINLIIQCSDILNSRVGVLGSGAIRDQGSASDDAGNAFYQHGTSNFHNTEWDIYWQDNASISPEYFYEDLVTMPGYEAPNSYLGLSKPSYFLNGTLQLTNDLSIIANHLDFLACPIVLQPASTESDMEEKGIKVYPNPTKDILFMDGLPENMELFSIVNSMCQTVGLATSAQLISGYDVSEFTSGVYFIHSNANSGELTKKKFVVSR